MALTLWTSETDGIDLGNPLEVLTVWKELAVLVGSSEAQFAQLLAIPYTDEEVVAPEYLAQVRQQAGAALGLQMSEGLRWRLETLAGREGAK